MPQLDIATYPSQVFWLLACMLFLLSFVKHVFVPRMGAVLELRDKKIYGDLERTKEIKEIVQQLRKECTAKINENKLNACQQKELQVQEFETLRASRAAQITRAFTRKRTQLEKETRLPVPSAPNFVDLLLKR